MNERPPLERILDFYEVEQTLSAEEAVIEAERCIQCKNPLCVTGCPISVPIPEFIRAIADRDFSDAARTMKQENLFPSVCGRVCPQEVQCEGVCLLGRKERPVKIGALERFIGEWDRSHTVPSREAVPLTDYRVAIVGAGPAGLAAASELAKFGHRITVYESLHEPGGVLTYGIPEFRLPKSVVRYEIEQVRSLGVDIRLNHVVGRSVSVSELMQYDAVFLGTGAGLPSFLQIPGEDLAGVYSANEFLTRINLMHAERFPSTDTPVKLGTRVVVIGGGNVAMDAARICRRLHAHVTLLYRRRFQDLPARREEIRRAVEEGVEFTCCTNPLAILGKGRVTGIECIRMQTGDPDEGGRPRTHPIPGTNFSLECDLVIEAIGQIPNPLLVNEMKGLIRGPGGNVLVDDEGQTSIERVFAAGDIATGAATVIMAMGGAKKAAQAINRIFQRSGQDVD